MTNLTQGDQFYAAMLCRDCGQVPLSEAEYLRQLDRPDCGWACPKCGDAAEFDDTYFESHHSLNEECDDEPAF